MGVESGLSAFMRVSMSKVNDVDVRAGVVEGQGAGGAEGQLMVARWLMFVQVWSDLLVAVPLKICCTA